MAMDWEVERWLAAHARDMLPNAEERTIARDAHRELRALLRTGEMERRIVRSYLSGSYVRHTAIRPLNDVDIVFEIVPARWRSSGWFEDDLPKPEKVIETFARALRDRVRGGARVRSQRCSVGVTMNGIHIDVVPAAPVFDVPDGGLPTDVDDDAEGEEDETWESLRVSDRVRIPDSDTDRWIDSNPRAHVRLAAAINRQNGGLFKPLVRLLKVWKRRTPFSSFATETIAAHVFRANRFGSLTDALDSIWDFISDRGGEDSNYEGEDLGICLEEGFLRSIEIPDIAGTGSNVGAKYGRRDAEGFVRAAMSARDNLRAARVSRKDVTLEQKLKRLFRVERG